MVKSSTEPFTGRRRLLLAGGLLSVSAHVAGLMWWVQAAAPLRPPAAATRPLVVTWVQSSKVPSPAPSRAPVAPAAQPEAARPVGVSVQTPPALAGAAVALLQAPAPVEAAASAPLPQSAASTAVAPDAPVAGVALAPPQWRGFAAGWGRARVARPVPQAEDAGLAQVAEQQAQRMAAQQQQAQIELAWRTQADAAQHHAGW